MEINNCIRLKADDKQIARCRKEIGEIDNQITEISSLINLAGNPVRLKILYLLNIEKRLCVCDLSDILRMNVSAISQHLRKLKDRRLIYAEKEAQTIFYALHKEKFTFFNSVLSLVTKNELHEINQ